MKTLKINGTERQIASEGDTPLLWVLREELGLTGTKFGCGQGLCGACTVHVDGAAVRSCQTWLDDLEDGVEVTTIEGLHPTGAHPLQLAWIRNQVPQCGYCQSGQIMQAADLLAQTPDPTDAQIAQAMNGNLCRCMTYAKIRAAIRSVASA